MLFWYRTTQEVVGGLPTLARIISAQNPNSLNWATGRFEEFNQRLVFKHKLVPDHNDNGTSCAGGDEDELAFFDNFIGERFLFENWGVSLRLSLQISAGTKIPSESFFDITMYIDHREVREKEPTDNVHCFGEIRLRAKRGTQWELYTRTNDYTHHYKGLKHSTMLNRYLGEFICLAASEDDLDDPRTASCYMKRPISAKDVRALFDKMVEYYKYSLRSKQGKPSPTL
ncbi:MAG: hypothetical protein ABIH21_03795 [Patescibacteria group bacterium]